MKKFKLILALLFLQTCFFTFGQNTSFTVDVTNGCRPLPVHFTNTSAYTMDTTGVHFIWQIDYNYQIEAYDTSYVFENGGEHTVSLCAIDSFGNPFGGCQYQNIYVSGNTGNFGISTGHNICLGQQVNFSSYSWWNWMKWIIEGDTIENNNYISHTFNSPGIYDVVFIGEDQCGVDTIIEQMYASNDAVPEVSISGMGGSFCPGNNATFNSAYFASSYLWNFGDGSYSVQNSTMHSFAEVGDYQVILTVTNACGQTNSDTSYVNIRNDVEVYADMGAWPSEVCPGENVNFYTWTSGNYSWNLGDGTFSSEMSFYHAYVDTGFYNIVLIVSNNCGNADTVSQTVHVRLDTMNIPGADIYFENFNNWDEFGPVTTIDVCPGTEVRFNSNTWGGTVNMLWDFGDGATSTESNPAHIFNNPGINEVMFIVSNACGGKDTVYRWVNVVSYMPLESNLQVLPTTICPGEYVYFFDNNFNGESGNTYDVFYGDGQSTIGITEKTDTLDVLAYHIYSTPGTYDFIFRVTNSCGNTDSITGQIIVDETGSHPPFYYVMNSTMDEQQGGGISSLPNWGQPTGSDDYTMTIPFTFDQWTTGMNNTFYIVFWYGGLDIFNGDPGSPNGIIMHEGTGTVTAYVPNQADSVVVAGIWYCGDPDQSNNGPDAFGILGAFPIIASGDTTFDPPGIQIGNWDGTCDPVTPQQNPEAGCPGDNVMFMAVGGLQYEWHVGDSIFNQQFAIYNYPDTGFYDEFVVITNGCDQKDTVYTTVEIGTYNTPYAWFYNSGGNSCVSEPINFYPEDGDDMGNNDYYWDFGDGAFSTEKNPSHLYSSPGQYDVILTVTNGCGSSSQSNQIWVSGPEITLSKSDGCEGMNNGTISANVESGWWPMDFLWSNGATTQNIYNLAPGTYTVTVTDNGGCSAISSIEITPTNPLITFEKTDISCNGNTDGNVVANIGNALEPYFYYWSTGETTQDIYNLSSGIYNLTVVDGNGCNSVNNVEIIEPEVLSSTIDAVNLTCYQSNNGSIDLTPTGGTSPFTYYWSCAYFSTETEDLTDLAIGTYDVTITDSRGCTTSNTATLTQPTQMLVNYSITDATCGATDGSIDLTVSGGITPYSFIWTNGATTEDLLNYPANFYGVTVTDANDCNYQSYFSIENPGAPSIDSYDVTYATCNGDADGAIDIVVSGGTSPLTYLWSNSETTQNISGLTAGNYSVTVTDALSCVVINPQINVWEPELMTVDVTIENVSCKNYSDGSLTANVNGGNGLFYYNWSNTETTQVIDYLSPGTYALTVTDNKGCIAYASNLEITEPDYLTLSFTKTNVLCDGGNNGAITANTGGGTSPYFYLWSTTETTETITGLSAGVYAVTITDFNGCETDSPVTITAPAAIYTVDHGSTVSCYGGSDGTADVYPYGGVSPYNILWETTESTNIISNLASGYYSYLITDANGCEYIDSVFVDSPAPIEFTLEHTDISCNGADDGTALLDNITGGSGSYGYHWSNNGAFQLIENLTPGTYYITVSDYNNCEAYGSVEITEPDSIYQLQTFEICSGDSAYINGAWQFMSGEFAEILSSVSGCDSTIYTTLLVHDAIVVDLPENDSICIIGYPLDMLLDAGNPGMTYLWSNGETTQTITVGEGNTIYEQINVFSVTVTDGLCYGSDSIALFVGTCENVPQINPEIEISLYPNPNDGTFYISAPGTTEIKIFNILGEQVLFVENPANENAIVLNSMPDGIYLTEITVNNTIFKKMFVIKR